MKCVDHISQPLIWKEGDQCTSKREKSNDNFFRQFFLLLLLLFSGWTKKNKSRQMMKSNLSLSLSLSFSGYDFSLFLVFFFSIQLPKKDHIGSCSLYWDRLKKKNCPTSEECFIQNLDVKIWFFGRNLVHCVGLNFEKKSTMRSRDRFTNSTSFQNWAVGLKPDKSSRHTLLWDVETTIIL